MHTPPHLDLQVISPEKIVFSAPVSMVVIPAFKGALGILPNHAPIISNLQSGVVEIFQEEQQQEKIFVAGGFAEITPQSCKILTEDAIFVSEINIKELENYIATITTALESTPEIDEQELLRQNLTIARAKIEIFRSLNSTKQIH